MAARGRQSAASLAVVTTLPGQRPPPPASLSSGAAEEWRAIASRMPADWFTRETHAILALFCDQTASQEVLRSRIVALETDLPDEMLEIYDRLLGMRERLGRSMALLATKLRITHQSRYDPAKAHTAAKQGRDGQKPWEFTG